MMIRKVLVAETTAAAVALSLSAGARDDQAAEDFFWYGGGTSVSVTAGASRKEFYTDRMTDKERQELAVTNEAWGGYVESLKGSVGQEGRP